MTRTLRLGLATALMAALLLATATAADATRRYASPNGKTTGFCTSPIGPNPNGPCTFRRAVEEVAVSGDEVLVLPGTHTVTGTVVADVPLTIHGANGQPRPRVVGETHNPLRTSGDAGGTVIARLQLEGGPSAAGEVFDTTPASTTALAEDLVVLGVVGGVDLDGGWTLRNSVVRSPSGVNASGGPGPRELRNLTVIATNAGSEALRTLCSVDGTITVNVKNAVLRGGESDIETSGCGQPTVINISFSNYRADKVANNGAVVNDQGGNQTNVDPLFVDPANGDFHQLAGSPTIDAGTSDPLIGAKDFDGDSRTLGAAPDIGADEYIPGTPGGGPGGGGDPGGGDGGGDPGTTVTDTTVPVAKDLRVKPKNVEAASSGDSIAAATGTTVSYSISELGQVTFTVERAAPGRKKGKKCVKPRRRNRKAKPCTRYVKVKGSFDHAAVAGQNSFRFTGRLNRRKLKKGSYRLVGAPVDVAANKGKAVTAKFNIVKK